jgi:N-acetylneuraminate synthase
MTPTNIVPENANESLWNIMERCVLGDDADRILQARAHERGLLFLSTPFSRQAADRLYDLGVPVFKIGSGECSNYPLVEHIASLGKPVIVSTGMNDIPAISGTVEILRRYAVPFALLQCTSIYPAPYEKLNLAAMGQMRTAFPDAIVGLSDHSPSIYPALGAIALGASIVEHHFTSDTTWSGPDMELSMNPEELRRLVEGSKAIWHAKGGYKNVFPEERSTLRFASASVVTISDVEAGEKFNRSNCWVKRPGTGEIQPEHYHNVLGRRAARALAANTQIRWSDLQ